MAVGKINTCLWVFKIMLETWNLVYKYTDICSFKNTLLLPIPLNFADVSIFFVCKKSVFFGRNITSTQSNSMRAVLEILNSVFSFCKKKCYSYSKCITKHASGIWLPDSFKLVTKQNNNDVKICRHDVIMTILPGKSAF